MSAYSSLSAIWFSVWASVTRVAPGIFFFLSGIVLSEITRRSPTPECSLSLWYAAPAFGVWILFGVSLFSLGAGIRKQLSSAFAYDALTGIESLLMDLTLGTVGVYLGAYGLTAIGLFSSEKRILMWLLLSAGVSWGAPSLSFRKGFERFQTKKSRALLGLPLLLVLLRLIQGLQFHFSGDPYVAYLPAPRVWAEFGNFDRFLNFSPFFLTTSWESLSAWGTALMGLQGGHGLDLSQFFAQWCIGGIAQIGIILTTFAIGERLLVSIPRVRAEWMSLASVAALQLPALRWMGSLSKSDLGSCFWGLSAFYFVIFRLPLSSPVLIAGVGVVLGAAVIGKLPYVILGLCLTGVVLLRTPRMFLWFVLGGLLGIAPVLLRNGILTHNPFFPWFLDIFPLPPFYLGPSVLAGAKQATTLLFKSELFFSYLKEILLEVPLIASIGIVLLAHRYFKAMLFPLAILVVSLMGFTYFLRPATEIRYQGPTLILVGIFSVYCTVLLINRFIQHKSPWVYRCLSLILALVIVAKANIPIFTLFQIGGNRFGPWSSHYANAIEIGGPAKLWIRHHLDPKESILIAGDGYPYYLIDYAMIESGSLPPYENLISQHKVTEALHAYRQSSFHFLYLASDSDYVPYRPVLREVMQMANLTWDLNCKRMDIGHAQVWDLWCLRD